MLFFPTTQRRTADVCEDIRMLNKLSEDVLRRFQDEERCGKEEVWKVRKEKKRREEKRRRSDDYDVNKSSRLLIGPAAPHDRHLSPLRRPIRTHSTHVTSRQTFFTSSCTNKVIFII